MLSEEIKLPDLIRAELKERYWQTSNSRYQDMDELVSIAEQIIDRLAAGDYNGS